MLFKWRRGDYHAGPHAHHHHDHRHLRHGTGSAHHHGHVRSPRQAFGIGMLHGLAGTGAVVVLLIAALPGRLEAAAALAVFAPMSIVSMALFTSAFAWVLTRPVVRAALPHRARAGAGRVRADLRALVRGDHVADRER